MDGARAARGALPGLPTPPALPVWRCLIAASLLMSLAKLEQVLVVASAAPKQPHHGEDPSTFYLSRSVVAPRPGELDLVEQDSLKHDSLRELELGAQLIQLQPLLAAAVDERLRSERLKQLLGQINELDIQLAPLQRKTKIRGQPLSGSSTTSSPLAASSPAAAISAAAATAAANLYRSSPALGRNREMGIMWPLEGGAVIAIRKSQVRPQLPQTNPETNGAVGRDGSANRGGEYLDSGVAGATGFEPGSSAADHSMQARSSADGTDPDDEFDFKRVETTRWNNLRGLWGKRSVNPEPDTD